MSRHFSNPNFILLGAHLVSVLGFMVGLTPTTTEGAPGKGNIVTISQEE